jgi:hypothetical protein
MSDEDIFLQREIKRLEELKLANDKMPTPSKVVDALDVIFRDGIIEQVIDELGYYETAEGYSFLEGMGLAKHMWGIMRDEH